MIKVYTDVIINNCKFSVFNYIEKPEGVSEIDTLWRIEHVINNQLQYDKSIEDTFVQLPESEQYPALMQLAKIIQNGYFKKIENLSSLDRF